MLNNLAEMTWRNPIFMIVFFGVVWFTPGIIIRRLAKAKFEKEAAKKQAEKIQRLYPKN